MATPSRYFPVILLIVHFIAAALACNGCVSLDEYSFDKILGRFEAALVKFDVAYPYGDKHEVFVKLADEVATHQDLLFAQVGVKDYGDKENEKLALRFGISKDDLPAIRLFVRDKAPVAFPQDSAWNVDNLRSFIRDNSDIYIGLPGCLEKFDKLAMDFVNSGNKPKDLEAAESVMSKLDENHKTIANVYLKFMRKIIENGTSFVRQEVGRLAKIIKEGKVNEKKKTELTHRLNILKSFSIIKDEL